MAIDRTATRSLRAVLGAHRALIAFALLSFLAFEAEALARGEVSSAAVYVVEMIALFAVVVVVHRRVGFSEPVLWGLALWGLAHMAGGLIPADGDRVLYNVWLLDHVLRYDQAVHFFGFGVATVACWEALRRWLPHSPRPSAGLSVLIGLMGLGVGAVNEVLEFLTTLLIPETNVGGYTNTGWDLVFNTLGATAAVALIRFRERRLPG